MPTWTNWAGTAHADVTVATPSGVSEIAELVGAAAARGQRVKPIGAGHSFTTIGVTDGVQLRLDRLAGIVRADRETGLVTVQAGTRLHALNEALWQLGLSMTNLGDIDVQSISGAISTGTHGTGLKYGGIATQVRALELVLADGSVLSCSADDNPDVFAAARVGLGSLGVLATVTLQCEPAFALAAAEGPASLDEVLAELDDNIVGNDHFEFYWFPHTDIALTKRNNRLAPGAEARPLKRWREWLDDEFLANTVFNATCALGKLRPSLVPRLNNTAAKALGARRFSAPSYEVFTSPRRVRFVEMEYAVPRAAIHDAVRAVQHVIERDNLQISFPIEVRVTAPDDIPLSTASGRDSAYVAIHRYRGEEFEGYFRAVEKEMKALDGRPHWGKMHWRTDEDLRPAYPRFDEFLAVRNQVDPDRVFANDYLDRVLGR